MSLAPPRQDVLKLHSMLFSSTILHYLGVPTDYSTLSVIYHCSYM